MTVCRIRMVARLILPGFLPWFINIITLKQVTQFLYCRMILKAILYVVYLQQNVRELKIVFSNWYCKSNVSILCLKRREKNWKATDLFFTTFWNTFCFKVKKVFFVRNCILYSTISLKNPRSCLVIIQILYMNIQFEWKT